MLRLEYCEKGTLQSHLCPKQSRPALFTAEMVVAKLADMCGPARGLSLGRQLGNPLLPSNRHLKHTLPTRQSTSTGHHLGPSFFV